MIKVFENSQRIGGIYGNKSIISVNFSNVMGLE